MQDFRELRIWKRAININKNIYLLSEKFPKNEVWGLTNQIRRASVSVASNIAEGRGRKTDKDFAHFLYHSRASLNEVITQLIIAESLKYIQQKDLDPIVFELDLLSKMIFGFIKKISGWQLATSG